MSISSVSSSSSAALIQWLASQNTQQGNSAGSATPLPTSDTSGSVGISHLSKFLSRLDDVAGSDPAKFKSMMSDIATKLSAAAGRETGEVSSSLMKTAEQFRKAAETGTTDPLRQDTSASDSYNAYMQPTTADGANSLLQLLVPQSADTSLSGLLTGLYASL